LLNRILPAPRRIEPLEGTCSLSRSAGARIRIDDLRVHRWFGEWVAQLPSGPSTAIVRLHAEPAASPHPDGYRLLIAANAVELVGASPAGCFHGLQTLRGIIESNRHAPPTPNTQTAVLPCCCIEDWPDFSARGLLHDVTRGKVPTLPTLKLLADRLAGLKANQLQLYIEHAFSFSFDPNICDPREGLTPDEIRELGAYCRDRFITLVPAVASFGHMGRILSLSRYRHLAEIEPEVPWEQLTWPRRARGFTLDCMNPEAHRLVERIWQDILAAFTSPVVNICGDEPWDLGAGRNRHRLTGDQKARAYVEQIERTHRICAAAGRRTQFWSDIIRHHADLISPELRSSTLLHWGYDDQAAYDATADLVASGVDTFVCPGTSGWKRILNAMHLAERNIAAFARAGRRHGATGLINTDWGDHGHFNALACSWHGIALGACKAWNADHPIGDAFDRSFALHFWNLKDSGVVSSLRNVSAAAEPRETWRILWQMLSQSIDENDLPAPDECDRLRHSARSAIQQIESAPFGHDDDFRELSAACRFSTLLADLTRLTRSGFNDRRTCESWSAEFRSAAKQYAANWRVRYKPRGLEDILNAMNHSPFPLPTPTAPPDPAFPGRTAEELPPPPYR
jgi:hypothetical protein